MEDYELEKLKSSRQMACDGWVYAIQRMDLLIISISGAGVYAILEALKYSLKNSINCAVFLKITGAIFVFAIIVNFISQWSGQKSNLFHIKYIDEKISGGTNPTEEQRNRIKTNDIISDKWNALTNYFNSSSMILMFLGLIGMIYYFIFLL